jgi:peptide/nickel transport system permease protein
MLRFAVRRALLSLLTLWAISVTTFGLFFAGPANPAATMCFTPSCPPEIAASINRSLGLDRPIVEQYSEYMRNIFVGRTFVYRDTPIECPAPCFGISFRTREPVLDILKRSLPVTLSIVLGGAAVYLLVGTTLGMVSAVRHGTLFDKLSVGLSLSFASMQIYFLGSLLMILLVWDSDLLPRPEYVSPTEDLFGWVGGMLLPWLTLGLINSAQYARFARAQMMETLSEDYVRTARAKGLTTRAVNVRHAFRAAVTPLVTIAGVDLAMQLGGVVITETTFSMLGIGRQAVLAATNYNLPIVMATVMIGAFFIVAANFAVDLLYAVIDPRVRLS